MANGTTFDIDARKKIIQLTPEELILCDTLAEKIKRDMGDRYIDDIKFVNLGVRGEVAFAKSVGLQVKTYLSFHADYDGGRDIEVNGREIDIKTGDHYAQLLCFDEIVLNKAGANYFVFMKQVKDCPDRFWCAGYISKAEFISIAGKAFNETKQRFTYYIHETELLPERFLKRKPRLPGK